MKKYLFNEIKGKLQGEMIIIEANSAEEAFEKSRFTEKIRPSEKFKSWLPGKMYELSEWGTVHIEYICR